MQQQQSFDARYATVLLACFLSLSSVSGPNHGDEAGHAEMRTNLLFGPGFPYEISQLLEAECGEVGSNLTIGSDPDAMSGGYVTTSTAIFTDGGDGTDIYEATADDYIRFTIREAGRYMINFRGRSVSTSGGLASLLFRVNNGPWFYWGGGCAYSTCNTSDWYWSPRELGTDDGPSVTFPDQAGPQTLDVAFAAAGQQFDQIYLELEEAFRQEFYRPYEGSIPLEGPNCPDFTNEPPVAILAPGTEGYPGNRELYGGNSYDPDGIIVKYSFADGDRGMYDLPEGNQRFQQPGDHYAYLTVADYHGATDTDSTLYRIVEQTPLSGRTTFRLQGECAASPGLPENQFQFSIPNVAAADAGRYYLAGAFTSTQAEDNCLRVNINGQGWHEWNIISPERSFYPGPAFNLVAGNNTIKVGYCDAPLEIDQFILSPDTGYPDILKPEVYKTSGKIVNVPCPATDLKDEFWLEAECAGVGSGWKIVEGPAASGGSYAVYPSGNSNTTPPVDAPANYVRFTVDSAQAGTYFLQARINAPSGLDDSYWVRVNDGNWYAWKSGMARGTGFSWNAYPGGAIRFVEGRNIIDFAYREDGTQLDKLYVSTTQTTATGTGNPATNCQGPGNGEVSVWMEAECADYGYLWTLGNDAQASNGSYLVYARGQNATGTRPNDGFEAMVRFTFPVAAESAGLPLYLYARVDAATPDNDSYWVRFNGGEWFAWTSILDGDQGFQWNRFPKALSGALDGTNILEFAYRERGAKLDRIYLSSVDKLTLSSAPSNPTCQPIPIGVSLDASCHEPGTGWRDATAAGTEPFTYEVHPGPRQLEDPGSYTHNFASSELSYVVNVPHSGVYRVFLYLNAPDESKNSVWVKVDAYPYAKL